MKITTDKNMRIVLMASALLVSVSVFIGLVVYPFNENKPFRTCISFVERELGLSEQSVWDEYILGEISDDEMSDKRSRIYDNYDSGMYRCHRRYKE